MATVYQCDRCNKIYKNNRQKCTHNIKLFIVDYAIDLSEIRNEVDLCPECVKGFDRWFNMEGTRFRFHGEEDENEEE